MVEPVTPRVVAPPLLPEYFATQGGAYTDQGTCFLPGPQRTPLRAMPLVDGATGPAATPPAPPAAAPPPRPPVVVAPGAPAAPPAPRTPGAFGAPVAPAVVPCCCPSAPPAVFVWSLLRGVAVGTRTTTSNSTTAPATNGRYLRATRPR